MPKTNNVKSNTKLLTLLSVVYMFLILSNSTAQAYITGDPEFVLITAQSGDVETMKKIESGELAYEWFKKQNPNHEPSKEEWKEMKVDLVTFVGFRGSTPLHYAARGGNIKVIEYLVGKGANLYAKDFFGATPLHDAAAMNQLQTVKYFFAKGVPLDVKDRVGKTPLHNAVSGNCVEVERFLINNGADVNQADQYGATPLHVAAYHGYDSSIKLLLEYNPSINVKDKAVIETHKQRAYKGRLEGIPFFWHHSYGSKYLPMTPLQAAMMEKHFSSMKILAKAGADPDFEDLKKIADERKYDLLFTFLLYNPKIRMVVMFIVSLFGFLFIYYRIKNKYKIDTRNK